MQAIVYLEKRRLLLLSIIPHQEKYIILATVRVEEDLSL
jgi:hypothetical protein